MFSTVRSANNLHLHLTDSGIASCQNGIRYCWCRDECDSSSRPSPLESAATCAPGKVFNLYMPAEDDPWFLEIEHFGTRYAAPHGEAHNLVFGEPPLLALADGTSLSKSDGTSQETINTITAKAAFAHHELETLKSSRSRLAKALVKSILTKRGKYDRDDVR
jgi:hypothetical protein